MVRKKQADLEKPKLFGLGLNLSEIRNNYKSPLKYDTLEPKLQNPAACLVMCHSGPRLSFAPSPSMFRAG